MTDDVVSHWVSHRGLRVRMNEQYVAVVGAHCLQKGKYQQTVNLSMLPMPTGRKNVSLQPPGRTSTLDSRVDGGLSRVTCRTPSPSRQGYICCTIAAMREAMLEHATGLTLFRGLSTKSPWAYLRRPELSCTSRSCRDKQGEEGGSTVNTALLSHNATTLLTETDIESECTRGAALHHSLRVGRAGSMSNSLGRIVIDCNVPVSAQSFALIHGKQSASSWSASDLSVSLRRLGIALYSMQHTIKALPCTF
jgi:hypothetical protein